MTLPILPTFGKLYLSSTRSESRFRALHVTFQCIFPSKNAPTPLAFIPAHVWGRRDVLRNNTISPFLNLVKLNTTPTIPTRSLLRLRPRHGAHMSSHRPDKHPQLLPQERRDPRRIEALCLRLFRVDDQNLLPCFECNLRIV